MYARNDSLEWKAEMATAANNIRLTVNQWLADNQSQYAGYAPFSDAVGTDVVIDGVTFQRVRSQKSIQPTTRIPRR